MKAHVYSIDGEQKKQIDLPPVFDEEFRPDVIRRAFLSARTARIQGWAADKMAGKRTSALWLGKGHGASRVPRVKGSRHPTAGRGAFVPPNVGGRRAHPPKTSKIHLERINKKERALAIRSAIAATKDEKLVKSRGHLIEKVKELPLVVSDEVEKFNKSKQARDTLEKIGLWQDVEKAGNSKKVRAGRGTMRGRRYRTSVGPLVVVGSDNGIVKAMRNLPGVDVVNVKNLNAELLAPGGDPARLTLWTESAIKELEKGVFS